MKISEIKAANVAMFLRLSEKDYTDEELAPIMAATSSYVKSYTGLSLAELDLLDDIYIAYMVLCQDMYDNRAFSVDNKCANRVVETILGMHCVNLV